MTGSFSVTGFVGVSVCGPTFSVCMCVSVSFLSICSSVDLSVAVSISGSVLVTASVCVSD